MHRTAEYGIAAHWKYKSGVTGTDSKDMTFENKLTWLRDILEWQKEAVDATEFMEGFKLDLFEFQKSFLHFLLLLYVRIDTY